MTAADRRAQLEALLWRNINPQQVTGSTRDLIEDILATADTYAQALASERIARMTSGQLSRLARIRERGEQATAEAFPRRSTS